MKKQTAPLSTGADQILNLLPKKFITLSLAEQRTALQIYRWLASGQPLSVEQLSALTGISSVETKQLLDSWPGVYLNEDSEIIGFWGITIAKMGHELKFGRQLVYAWCAWDAIFIPQLIGKQAQVTSTCKVTGQPIVLTIDPDGSIHPPDMDIYVSLLSLNASDMMDDVITHFCHYIYFFSSQEAGQEWTAENESTFLLPLPEVEELSKRKNALQFGAVL